MNFEGSKIEMFCFSYVGTTVSFVTSDRSKSKISSANECRVV